MPFGVARSIAVHPVRRPGRHFVGIEQRGQRLAGLSRIEAEDPLRARQARHQRGLDQTLKVYCEIESFRAQIAPGARQAGAGAAIQAQHNWSSSLNSPLVPAPMTATRGCHLDK